MTDKQLLDEIKFAYEKAGSLRALAEEWGVSAQYLCDILHERRMPGDKILRHYRLKRKSILVSVVETPIMRINEAG